MLRTRSCTERVRVLISDAALRSEERRIQREEDQELLLDNPNEEALAQELAIIQQQQGRVEADSSSPSSSSSSGGDSDEDSDEDTETETESEDSDTEPSKHLSGTRHETRDDILFLEITSVWARSKSQSYRYWIFLCKAIQPGYTIMIPVVDKSSFVPKREFLRSLDDEKKEKAKAVLPLMVPIVGLGCSGYSNFFWTKEELEAESHSQSQSHDNEPKPAFTAEMLSRDHPKVQEWIETIHYAIEQCGISLLDTAPWYGHGTSEIVVGWALDELLSRPTGESGDSKPIARNDLCVNTKIGRYEADPSQQFDFSRTATLESAQRSLRRMKCGYIDVLQLHDPEFSPTLDILLKETIPAMVECRANGWCRALGLTGYPLEVQYQILQHSLEIYGKDEAPRIWDQAITYGHFNLHDSSLVNRRVTPSCESFADCCQQNGMGLLAAAPLSMGLLTHNPPPGWHPANGSELATACRKAAEVCRELDVDIATLALLFAMSHPGIPCTILGMKDVEQVQRAAAVARRFAMVDWTVPGLSQELVLSFVLTVPESKAYRILSDKETGPFAGVWKRETENDYDGNGVFSPRYQWDGILEAHNFWKNAGEPFDDWQLKSFE